MRTRVKICGITNESDLEAAVSAGADAVGFNMYTRSPRYVDPALAVKLVRNVPPLVTIVGLFADQAFDDVKDVLSAVRFDLVQFHGGEPEEFCRGFDCPYLKALRVGPDTDIAAEAGKYPSSTGILLDTQAEGVYGGSGIRFDWNRIPPLDGPVILAGGLTPENVMEAIRIARPYAVDVSSGVEAAPGKKDCRKIEAFISAVRAADETDR